MLSTDDFDQAAEANRVRVVQVEAPRGRILDRNGTVLVDNRVSIVVTVDRVVFAELDDTDAADCSAGWPRAVAVRSPSHGRATCSTG